MNKSEIIALCHKYILELETKTKAIDATCGNGHDTLFLSSHFEEVYAFDIQDLAIKRTSEKCTNQNNVKIIKDSFENIACYINNVDLVLFNTGFLPGSDRRVKTSDYNIVHSIKTLHAKVIIICAYTRHEGGIHEYRTIKNYLKDIPHEDVLTSTDDHLLIIKKTSLH